MSQGCNGNDLYFASNSSIPVTPKGKIRLDLTMAVSMMMAEKGVTGKGLRGHAPTSCV